MGSFFDIFENLFPLNSKHFCDVFGNLFLGPFCIANSVPFPTTLEQAEQLAQDRWIDPARPTNRRVGRVVFRVMQWLGRRNVWVWLCFFEAHIRMDFGVP